MNADANSVERFDGRSDDYARYRPSYPSGAIDLILAGLGAPQTVVAIDAGAGTGISLALLRDRGVRAIGLEPNAGMRAEAARLGLDVRPGTVLENALPRGEATLVTAFQAFHWFADAASARSLATLLRPGGRIALVWNLFDRTDGFTNGFCTLLDTYCDPQKIAGLGYDRVIARTGGASEPPVQSLEDVDGSMIGAALASAGFVHVRIREVPYVQCLNEPALLGRLRSSSSAPTSGPGYEAMAAALHELVAATDAPRGAEHALAHRTHVVLAELAAASARG